MEGMGKNFGTRLGDGAKVVPGGDETKRSDVGGGAGADPVGAADTQTARLDVASAGRELERALNAWWNVHKRAPTNLEADLMNAIVNLRELSEPMPEKRGAAPWWLEHTLMDERLRAIDVAAQQANGEARSIVFKYPPLNSLHEGLGVLVEEFQKEFVDAVHANDVRQAKIEAKQIAAVCLRIIAEIKFR